MEAVGRTDEVFAIERQIIREVVAQPVKRDRGQLPKHLPRIERVVEPESTL